MYIPVGAVFNVWTGGYCCPGEKVAVLACVSIGGYHSEAKYQWHRDGVMLDSECQPILYTSQSGMFKMCCAS